MEGHDALEMAAEDARQVDRVVLVVIAIGRASGVQKAGWTKGPRSRRRSDYGKK